MGCSLKSLQPSFQLCYCFSVCITLCNWALFVAVHPLLLGCGFFIVPSPLFHSCSAHVVIVNIVAPLGYPSRIWGSEGGFDIFLCFPCPCPLNTLRWIFVFPPALSGLSKLLAPLFLVATVIPGHYSGSGRWMCRSWTMCRDQGHLQFDRRFGWRLGG